MKFEEVENISKALQEERHKSGDLLTRYNSVASENDILKKKLMTMGEDMTKLKNSVKEAFEEEEITKVNIKELVTAMQGQLTAAQERILEKEKENLELLQILQKVKDMGLLANFGAGIRSPAEPVEEENEEESQEEGEEEEPSQQDKLYKMLSMMQGNVDGRESIKTNSIRGGMVSDRRLIQAEDDDYDSEYQPAIPPKKKVVQKVNSKALRDSHGLGQTMSMQESTTLKQSTSKTNLVQGRHGKSQNETKEDPNLNKRPKPSQVNPKALMAAKALHTIKKTKETIQKIQETHPNSASSYTEPIKKHLADPKPAKRTRQRPSEEKITKEEKTEMLSKMGMISEMASVLKSFESKIKQMQSDMGRLVAK